jgi:hypothetical protein
MKPEVALRVVPSVVISLFKYKSSDDMTFTFWIRAAQLVRSVQILQDLKTNLKCLTKHFDRKYSSCIQTLGGLKRH